MTADVRRAARWRWRAPSQPNSVGSQFFIVLDDGARGALASANTYQIIGHVTSGMETADAIAAARPTPSCPSDPVA